MTYTPGGRSAVCVAVPPGSNGPPTATSCPRLATAAGPLASAARYSVTLLSSTRIRRASCRSFALLVNVNSTGPAATRSTPAVSNTNVSGAASTAVTASEVGGAPDALSDELSELEPDGAGLPLVPGPGLVSPTQAAAPSTTKPTTASVQSD